MRFSIARQSIGAEVAVATLDTASRYRLETRFRTAARETARFRRHGWERVQASKNQDLERPLQEFQVLPWIVVLVEHTTPFTIERVWLSSTMRFAKRKLSRPARSVSRFLYPPRKRMATIRLGLPSLKGSSDLPGSGNGAGHSSSPIWSCFTWGLPCQPDCSSRGALLPHLFTLTRRGGKRYIFCGTFRSAHVDERSAPGR